MFGNLFNQKGDSDKNSQDANVSQQPQQQSSSKEERTEETVSGGGGFGVAAVGSDFLGDPVTVVAPVVSPIVSSHSKVTETKNTNSKSQDNSQTDSNQEAGESNDSGENKTSSVKDNMTALSRLDPRSVKVLNQAQSFAKSNKQANVEPAHILYGLLYDNEIAKTFEKFSIDITKLSKEIEESQKKGEFSGQPTLSDASKEIFEESYNTAKSRGSSFVSPEDILLALFNASSTSEFLKQKGVEKESIEDTLSKSGTYTVAKKSMIEKYSIDLTDEARQGRLDPVTGRDREVERLIHILLRRTKNNPIIIGEAGVGKTAIVEGLAQKIVEGSVPTDLKERRLMQLDLTSLIAGASHRGEFEERFRAVIKEAQASTGQLILFIDEIHSLIGAGDDGGAMDASNIIKPYLARGQIQLIGTTTTSEFRKYFEKDKAFERRFQPVQVDEPDEETAIEMLKVIQPKYEKFHKVTYLPEAIEAAVKLSKKYVGERFLPDKAVDLLDEAGAEVKLQFDEGKRGTNVATQPQINPDVAQDQASTSTQQGGEVKEDKQIGPQAEDGSGKENEKDPSKSLDSQQKDTASDKTMQESNGGSTVSTNENSEEDSQPQKELKASDSQENQSDSSSKDATQENSQSKGILNPTPASSGNQVTKADIEKVVSAWTGIPITKLTEDESQKLLKLEELIHKRFIDQEEAVVTIAESIRRGRIGLASANRPIASFIFLGPTGVGKTELAKTIAEILFGKEEALVRLDMSEYMEKHEVAKLIGAPPGYVGYEEGGQLTEAVRTKPYSIVLLDEVEKAHPDVFNILLQLLEDGRLTDNKGNTISFKNTVIVATSNLGSAIIQKELAEGGTNLTQEQFDKKFSELSKTLMEELHKFFRPELLNRFDGLVIFKPLSQKDMNQIAKLSIEKTRKLLKEQGYDLQITQAALDQLAKEGYDPVYGARPLRRLIQTSIENPISIKIIGQEFVAKDTILIDYDPKKNEYFFKKAGAQQDVAKEEKEVEKQESPTGNESGTQTTENIAAEQNTTDNDAANGQNPTAETQSGQQTGEEPQSPGQEQVINSEPVYGDNNNGMTPSDSPTQSSQPSEQAPQPPMNGTSGTEMQKIE